MSKSQLLLVATLPLMLGTKECGTTDDTDGDTAPTSPFDSKHGAWTGNGGCNLGTVTLDDQETGYLELVLPVGPAAEVLFTSEPEVLNIHGDYTIMNTATTWNCTLTCTSATQMTLQCSNEAATMQCTELFTKDRAATWTHRYDNLRRFRHGR